MPIQLTSKGGGGFAPCQLTDKSTVSRGVISRHNQGNAMHTVRTQCEVLDVGKYSNPSFGPLSQVFGSVPGFFWLPKHLG